MSEELEEVPDASSVIDAHQHIWDLNVTPQPWIDPTSMTAITRSFSLSDARTQAASAGVQRAVLVQTVPDPTESQRLLAIAAEDQFVAGVVGWVDLTAADVPEQIARLREAPGGGRLVGLRHVVQDEPDPSWLTRRTVLAGLRAVAAAGLTYDLLVEPRHLPAALEAAQSCPELTFVLDHLGKPAIAGAKATSRAEWADGLRRLAGRPNVVAKLSGLITEADHRAWTHGDLRPYVDDALDWLGPSRLAFGSDWPVCLVASGGYLGWWTALGELLGALSRQERDEIYVGTTTRTYGLDSTGS